MSNNSISKHIYFIFAFLINFNSYAHAENIEFDLLYNLQGFSTTNATYQIGDTCFFRDRYPYHNRNVLTVCRGIGEHCYIFVEDSVWNNPDYITQDNIDDVLSSFESRSSSESIDSTKGIYELETNFWGIEQNSLQKISIVFINHKGITDGWTFGVDNPDHFCVTANAHTRWNGQRQDYYNHVISHEFYHVIDFTMSPAVPDLGLLSEGCAELSSFLCGYYEPGLKDTISYHNLSKYSNLSLIPYQIRMNYALGFTFMLYLYEKYGGQATFQKLILKSGDDINAINDVLRSQDYSNQFRDVFWEWQLAVYLDHSGINNSKFKFDQIEINSFKHYKENNDYPLSIQENTINPWAGHFIGFKSEQDISLHLYGDQDLIFTTICFIENEIIVQKLDFDSNYNTMFRSTVEDSITILVSNLSDDAKSYNYDATQDTQVSYTDNMPSFFQLNQNYPNPFNPTTTIKYNLQKSNNVTLKIYNLAGQELETLVNGFQTKGDHEITWQPKGLPSGIYFYRLQAGDFSETKKLLLQK